MFHRIKYWLGKTPYKYSPKQARKAWTKALRSGEYQQTKAELCTITPNGEHKYCCLGVACDLMIKLEGKDKLPTVNLFHGSCIGYGAVKSSGHMPGEAMNWLGLRSGNGSYRDVDNSIQSLANLNDSKDQTFEQIADVIDSCPPLLLAGDEDKCGI